MNVITRMYALIRRLLSGEDIVPVRQTKEHWNSQYEKGAWDRLTYGQPNTEFIADYIIEQAKRGEAISVLDVGCGNGGLARLLSEQVNISYCGLDISPTAIETAQSFHPHAKFIVSEAMTPPETLGTFDIIVFNEVVYYFEPADLIGRYKLHARPGTVILVSIVRTWRSWFIWSRVGHVVRIETKRTLKDEAHVWDIAIASYI
jgi:2-polyprenyl-3-methyl-5-hydroxy-6-metoxy-1,4-benzoquinol methylase